MRRAKDIVQKALADLGMTDFKPMVAADGDDVMVFVRLGGSCRFRSEVFDGDSDVIQQRIGRRLMRVYLQMARQAKAARHKLEDML